MEENNHNKHEPVIEGKNSLPYPTRTMDPPISLVDRAREIESAGNIIQSHVNAKLDVILKQIQSLQNEAKKIIQQAEEDILLHKINCSFEKKQGMEIHLYSRKNGDYFFSIISPAEWEPPGRFIASYKIRPDYSFDKINKP